MKRKKKFANVFFNITFCKVVYLQDRIENIYSMALIFVQFGTFEICGTNFCDLHILISSTRNYFFFHRNHSNCQKHFLKILLIVYWHLLLPKNQYKGQVTVLTKKPRSTQGNEKHNHETRFSSSDNFYINPSRLNQNQGSFARFGAKLWNSICDEFCQLPKRAFKKHINDVLFSLLEAEDDYDESPILLQKNRELSDRHTVKFIKYT